MVKRFRLAPMSPPIRVLTLVFLALPPALIVIGLWETRALLAPGLVLVVIDAWVWLRFRPSRFLVHDDRLEVIWPLKRREVHRGDITRVRLMDRQGLQKETGWGLRVGAGGLWGGFGWLWTQKRGIVQMYVSRTDGFVWIERTHGRPWLITPEKPESFVRALSVRGSAAQD